MLTESHSSVGSRLVSILFVVSVFVISTGPLIALGVETFVWLWSQTVAEVADVFSLPRQFGLLAKSVVFSVAVTLGDLVIGFFAASLFWTWNTRASRIIAFGLLSMIAIPPYIHVLAWRVVVDWLNNGIGTIGLPELAFSGWGAAWWVQTMAFAPVTAGLTLLGLSSVDVRLFDAGRILREDIDTFLKVVLPQAAPPIIVAGGFVFLFTIVDYSVPSAFLVNTYALEIFAEFSANHSAARALLISLPFLALTFAILLFVIKYLRQVVLLRPQSNTGWTCTPYWPRWFTRLQRLAVAILLLQFAVPILGLGASINSWEPFADALVSASDEIYQTVRTSALAAFLSLPIAFFIATRISDARSYWWLIILLPIGTPAPLVGIGLIALWNSDFTVVIYDGELILILTYLARFLPISVLVLYVQIRRMDQPLLDSAKILRPNALALWVQVYIPMMMRAGIAAMLLVFAFAIGELPASLLTVPPGSGTVTIRVYNYMHYGASEMVASLCLLIPLLTVSFAVLLLALAWGWRVLLPRTSRKFL